MIKNLNYFSDHCASSNQWSHQSISWKPLLFVLITYVRQIIHFIYKIRVTAIYYYGEIFATHCTRFGRQPFISVSAMKLLVYKIWYLKKSHLGLLPHSIYLGTCSPRITLPPMARTSTVPMLPTEVETVIKHTIPYQFIFKTRLTIQRGFEDIFALQICKKLLLNRFRRIDDERLATQSWNRSIKQLFYFVINLFHL